MSLRPPRSPLFPYTTLFRSALERMRAAVRRRPGQANLLGLANLESRLGRMDDARRTLAGLLARFPNDRNARSFLAQRSEEHTSELQSRPHLVCRLLLEKKKY